MQDQTTISPASSSERSSSSAPQTESKEEGMDSDEEIGRVPEFGLEQGGPSTSGTAAGTSSERAQSSSAAQASARRRGRSPAADKEHRRLKRSNNYQIQMLLRNRVSAQQARERRKAYVTELEAKVKDLEKRNSELEERLSTLQNENQMLRQILKNTTVNRTGPGSSAGGDSQ